MKLPSHQEMDTRLAQEMARCCAQFDESREDLAQEHGKITTDEADLVSRIKSLEPRIDAIIETGKLDKSNARICQRYLELNAKLAKSRRARRIAFPSTLPVGKMQTGSSIGDPK